MIFGLFKKSSEAERAGTCACQPSDPPPTQSPFQEVAQLTHRGSHEYVALAQCKVCGRAALYYAADVYDDFWQHWCTIDEAERAALAGSKIEDESDLAAHARAVLERHPHLVNGPVRGFEWAPTGCAVVEGPPW